MSRTSLILAAVALVAVGVVPVRAAQPASGKAAEADVQILLDAVRANRKALVAANLDLTDEEAGKFWPVYDRYQNELKGIQDRLVAVIESYTSHFRDLADDKALALVEDYLAAESDRFKIRRSYLEEFGRALPGRKVARFYQIENKMDAVIRYDLAATIPVIDEKAGAAPAR